MSLKPVLFFILTFLFCFNLSAQIQKEALRDSIKRNVYGNPEKAISYCHEYIELMDRDSNAKLLSQIYSAMALAYESMGKIDSTLYYYDKSLKLAKKPKDKIYGKYFIAKIYDNNYRYNEALRLYGEVLNLSREQTINKFTLNYVELSIELIKSKVETHKKFPTSILKRLEDFLIYCEKNKKKAVGDIRIKLIEAYLRVNKTEEAISLIETGIKQAGKENNLKQLYYLSGFKSRVYKSRGKTNLEIKSLNKAIAYATKIQNITFVEEAKFKLAENTFKQKDYKRTLNYLKEIKLTGPNKTKLQLSKSYKLFSDTYKALDSIKKSDEYIVMYLKTKDESHKEYIDILDKIYNITLNEEVLDLKENHQSDLEKQILENEKEKQTKWFWIIISAILLLLIIGVVVVNKKRAIKNQKRFDELMVKINIHEREQTIIKNSASTNNLEEGIFNSSSILSKEDGVKTIIDTNENNKKEEEQFTIIKDKKVEEILLKLKKLEEKTYFLRQDCTLHNMAKRLKTNTTYLSKVINTHLGKSFSTYVNDLRINYVIIELKKNKRLRSYSVKAIAEEMGYKNANIFSRYFKEVTGITPSVYIKKIQEI